MERTGGERRKRKTNSRRWLGRRRPILGEKGEEVIDGTSVMVQPSISRTYTFIIYYPRRYGYFASGTSYLSLSLSPPDYSTSLFPSRRYARCIGKAQRPSSDEATFPRPSIRPRIRPCTDDRLRSSLRSIDLRKYRENLAKNSTGKFENAISFVRSK